VTDLELADRLARLARRGDALLADVAAWTPEPALQLVRCAWEEALSGAERADASRARSDVSRLDAVLCLLERITRPARWLDEQATWFGRATQCVLDAAAHVAQPAPVPPPILVVEPIDSPLYVARAHVPAAWLAQATPANLPLPLVLCPGALLEEPWQWATLFHELGHHVDAALGDSSAVLGELRSLEDQERIGLGFWLGPSWVRESVADVYAGLLGGDGAVETLTASFTERSASSSHPGDPERRAVLEDTWRCLRGGPAPVGATATAFVARSLVSRFEPWVERLRADAGASDELPSSARLVPGWMGRKRRAGASASELRVACERAFDTEKGLSRQPWQLTADHVETLRRAMRYLVATHHAPDSPGLKVPPVDLLARHDRISFVGATHGQLLPKLREARARRTTPWRHIELFVLEDEPLRELQLGGVSGEALIAERDASVRDIHAYLDEQAVRHAIYFYRQPYLFGSFWDVDRESPAAAGAPPAHVHVSSAPWGMDLRYAISEDLEAPAGEPLPAPMRARVEALGHLRAASRLHCGHPSEAGSNGRGPAETMPGRG
jgi:hypothetical protein